jgi:hypothetical protein
LPTVPPNWLGMDSTYPGSDGKTRKRVSLNILSVVLKLLVQPISLTIIDLSVLFNFKTTISLLIFIVIGTELYFKKQISQQAVILVAISLVVLYLELIIEKAKRITIWKFFEWERKEENN